MKIKLFTSYRDEDPETQINEFLEGKTLIDIQMNTIELGGKVFSKFMVLYHEPQQVAGKPLEGFEEVTTYVRPKGSSEPFRKPQIVEDFLKLNEAIGGGLRKGMRGN